MVAVPSVFEVNVTPAGRAPVLVIVATGNPLEVTVNENGVPTVADTAALLVIDGARSFVYLKMALTAGTVTLLVLLIRVRAFGRYLAGPILLTSALAYVVLVGYEYLLLMQGLD